MQHETHNLELVPWGWLSPEPGLVAGYLVEKGTDNLHLYAVLKYPPITGATLRAISLRQLDDPTSFSGPRWPVGPPPAPNEVAKAWGDADGLRLDSLATTLRLTPEEKDRVKAAIRGEHGVRLTVLKSAGVDNFLTQQWLTRTPDDTAADFYARVADTYLILLDQGVTDIPLRLAQIASGEQTPDSGTRSTVRSWIYRARARHFIPSTLESDDDE